MDRYSLKRLQTEKKYLKNITELQQRKGYNNPSMKLLKTQTEEIIEKIEIKRRGVDQSSMLHHMIKLMRNLNIISYEEAGQAISRLVFMSHVTIVKMFGADAAGPEALILSRLDDSGNTIKIHEKRYYNDKGEVIKIEPCDKP